MRNYEDLVYKILLEKPQARDDDYILMGFVLKKLGFDLNMRLRDYFINHEKMPSFKTIERCRRKIQEREPQLFKAEILCDRLNAEQDYKENFKRK